MNIRRFAESDMPAVLAIQGECAQAAQWHEQDYTRLAQDPAGLLLVAEVEPPTLDASASGVTHKDQRPSARSGVAGFAAFYTLIDEAELRNLAVARAHQRRGIGRALLEEAHRRLRESGVKRVCLEVRPSNTPALRLYHGLCYSLVATRKDYYQHPPEDGCVLSLIL